MYIPLCITALCVVSARAKIVYQRKLLLPLILTARFACDKMTAKIKKKR